MDFLLLNEDLPLSLSSKETQHTADVSPFSPVLSPPFGVGPVTGAILVFLVAADFLPIVNVFPLFCFLNFQLRSEKETRNKLIESDLNSKLHGRLFKK